MKKGDVGMAKRFSKKYGNKGRASTTCNPMSRCLSAPDATSLHPASRTIVNIILSYIIYLHMTDRDPVSCL